MDGGVAEASVAGLGAQGPGRDLIHAAALLGVHAVAMEFGLDEQLGLGGHAGGGARPVADAIRCVSTTTTPTPPAW